MNVYILTKAPFPEGMASTNRLKCVAKAFLSQGVNCKVVLFGKTDTHCKLTRKGLAEGIPYEFVGVGSRRWKGDVFGRFQSFLLMTETLFFLFARLHKGDAVWGYLSEKPRYNSLLIDIIHLKGAKFVPDYCEAPYATSIITSDTERLMMKSVRTITQKYDGIMTISDNLTELVRPYAKQKCVIEKVPIMVDFVKYTLPDRSAEAEIPYIFHSGTLSEQKDGILGMLEAFGIAANQYHLNIRFVSTGNLVGSRHENEIRELVKKYDIADRVFFLGYVDVETLKDYLSKASLVIINKYRTLQNKYCFSTKLGEYMAAGKPVILTRVGEAMNWVQDGENAYVVEPENVAQLAQTIARAFGNIEECRRIGENGKRLSKNSFSYTAWGGKLVEMVRKMNEGN